MTNNGSDQIGLDFDITSRRHGGNPESEAAHESTRRRKQDDQLRIAKHIALHGARTCEAVAQELGMRYTTASARISELKAAGRLFVVGRGTTSTGCAAALLDIIKPKELLYEHKAKAC